MISYQRKGDNGNGPDRVIEYIATHKTPQTPRVPQIQPMVMQEPVTVPDEILVAPEDNKGPDRVSEHLHMYLHVPMSLTTKSRE